MACVAILNPTSTLTLFRSFIESFVVSFVAAHSLEIFMPSTGRNTNDKKT